NHVEVDLITDLVAARWRLRRVWRYETALLDVEMDSSAEEFEGKYEQWDEDMRGAEAFAKLTNESRTLTAAHNFERRLSHSYRRTLDQLLELQSKSKNHKTNGPTDKNPPPIATNQGPMAPESPEYEAKTILELIPILEPTKILEEATN